MTIQTFAETSQTSMRRYSSFPEAQDILSEIFKRLPLQSVRQCKRVKKSWYYLIKTRDFKILHFHYQKPREEYINYHIILRESFSESLLSIGFDDGKKIGEDRPYFSVDHRWQSYVKPSHCVICFANERTTYLWNPATREEKNLPPCVDHIDRCWKNKKLNMHYESSIKIAFEYLSKINDFIVIKVFVYRTCEQDDDVGENWSKWYAMVDVYSLNSNSWKSVEVRKDYVVELLCETSSKVALINGVVYCWDEGKVTSEKKLVGFNIESEISREIVLPDDCLKNDFVIEAFGESVSLLSNMSDYVKIWVLEGEEENGVWTKKISINLERLYVWPPLGFRSNGELVLKTSDWRFRLVSCNVDTGEKMVIFDLRDCLCSDSFVQGTYVFHQVVFMDNLL